VGPTTYYRNVRQVLFLLNVTHRQPVISQMSPSSGSSTGAVLDFIQ
jgi:hypothetical protein